MHTYFSPSALQEMDRFYRANLLNSLNGFKTACLIGTVNKEGQTNLGLFSNIVHLGADPALVGYINRPRAASPHTLANIEATEYYTINHIHTQMLQAGHACSAKWPENISEFEATGLTPQFLENIPAPFVAESRIKYALKLVEIVPIKWNGTFLVIGSICGVWLKESAGLIAQDGFLALEKTESIASLGLDGYYMPQPITRLPYARPEMQQQLTKK